MLNALLGSGYEERHRLPETYRAKLATERQTPMSSQTITRDSSSMRIFDPPLPRVGKRIELTRYRVGGAERILYGQRIDNVVRVIDRPANGHGRCYLIERGLEKDSYAALKALVVDYVRQGEHLQAVPMASSAVRRAMEQEQGWRIRDMFL